MNGIEYLLDTNVLIYILQGKHQVRYFADTEKRLSLVTADAAFQKISELDVILISL